LLCTGNPTVRWFRDDEEIVHSDEFQLVNKGETQELVFSEIFPDDSGVYTCVIHNPAGEERCSCVMTVQGRYINCGLTFVLIVH